MAIKELALITEKNNRKKKKEKEILKAPTTKKTISKPTVKSNDKGKSYVDKSTISKKPTVQKTTQKPVVTNKERLSSKDTFAGVKNTVKPVKSTKKRDKISTGVYDVYKRDGKYYYDNGNKEIEIDKKTIENAQKNKRTGIIGHYDKKGKFTEIDENGRYLTPKVIRKDKKENLSKQLNAMKNDIKSGNMNVSTAITDVANIADAATDFGPAKNYKNALKTGVNAFDRLWTGSTKTLEHWLDLANDATTEITSRQNYLVNRAFGMSKKEAKKEMKEEKKANREWVSRDLVDEFKDKTGYNKIQPSLEEGSLVKKDNLAGKVIEGVGGMLPSLAVGQATGLGIASKSTEGLTGLAKAKTVAGNLGRGFLNQAGANTVLAGQSYGSGLEEAYKAGAREKDARLYGLGSAATELLTEWISGGIPGTKSQGALDDIIENLIDKKAKKISNKYVSKVVASVLKSNAKGIGEGLEEALADMINPSLKNLTYSNGEKVDWSQVKESALTGYLIGMFLNSPESIDDLKKGINDAKIETARKEQLLNEIDQMVEEAKVYTPEQREQANEIAERVESGQIKEDEGLALLDQVRNGTYSSNKNLETIANQEYQNLQNQLQQGQMTEDQYLGELNNLSNAVNQTKEEINTPKELQGSQNISEQNYEGLNQKEYNEIQRRYKDLVETIGFEEDLKLQGIDLESPSDMIGHLKQIKDIYEGDEGFLEQARNENPEVYKNTKSQYDKINRLINRFEGKINQQQTEATNNQQETNQNENRINDHTLEYNGYYIMSEKPNVGYEYKSLEESPRYQIYDANNDDITHNVANWVNSIDEAKQYIDNINNLNIENDNNIEYNNGQEVYIDSRKEYAKAMSVIHDDMVSNKDTGIRYANTDEYYYVYNNEGFDKKPTITMKIPINEKNSSLIDAVKGEINNGTYSSTKDISAIIENFESGRESNNRNNVDTSERNSTSENDRLYQEQPNSNNTGNNAASNETSIENERTEEGSFSDKQNNSPEILDKMPTEKKSTLKSLKKGIDTFRKEITDRFAAVYDMAQKTRNKTLYHKADRILASDGLAQVDLDANQVDLRGKPYKNFTDEKGNKVSMGFETAYDLYKNISNKEKNEFIVHQLNIDRWNQGVDQFGIPLQESQQKVEELRKKYEKIDDWAENIYQYYRNLGQKMVDNGRVSQEQMDSWWESTPHYVHIQRQVQNQGNTGVSVKGGTVDSDNLIRKVKGGNYAILPIKETTAKFTQNASRAFTYNDFGKEYARTIGTDARGENVSADTNIDEIFGFEPEFVNTDGKGTYTMKIYENGMPVEIPISKEIYEALSPQNIPRVGILAEATSVYKDLLTNKNPFFGFLRNPIKDAQDMFLYSKHPLHKSLATYTKLFAGRTALRNRVITKDGVTAQDIVNFYHNTGNAVHSIYKNGQFETQKGGIRKGVDKALSPIEKGNDFMESMPRITEFWNTIQAEGYTLKDGELVPQKGKNPKKTVEQVIAEASYNAADVTVNFKRGGRTSKTISENGGIFFNPSVQGASKFTRNITEAVGDAKAGDFQAAKRLVARAAMMGVAPAILSAIMYGDDDEYKDIQDYQKDQYYIIKSGDGKWIRIPKGRAISLFQSATRRGGNLLNGDKNAFKGYGKLIGNQIAPNNPLDNNILSPITAAVTNKSWSGNKIVSDYMAENYAPEDQYNEKTDELSKKLGKQLHISPMKINYVIDQYSGVLGDLMLPQITPKSKTGSSNPVMNILRDNYYFDAANSSKSVGEFYDNKNQLKKEVKKKSATDETKVQKAYLGKKSQELYLLSEKKRNIEMDKNLSKKEKYEKALEVQKQMNKLTKEAVKDLDGVKVDKYTATIGGKLFYRNENSQNGLGWSQESEKTTKRRKELGLSPEKYYYYKNEESYTTPDGYTKSITSGKNAKTNMAIVDAFKFDTSDYLEYTYKLSQIKGKKNSKGYTIRGTRQPKVLKYINSLPISAAQKAYLYKTQYSSYRDYDSQFVNTIKKSNLSRKEKEQIYSYLKLGR